jgi:hypothetical protein
VDISRGLDLATVHLREKTHQAKAVA